MEPNAGRRLGMERALALARKHELRTDPHALLGLDRPAGFAQKYKARLEGKQESREKGECTASACAARAGETRYARLLIAGGTLKWPKTGHCAPP